MNKIHWGQITIFALVVLLVLLLGSSLLGGFGSYGYGMYPMMGTGMMSGWGFPVFGWLGMLLMWLIPLGLLALLVAGFVGLVRMVSGPPATTLQAPRATGTCSNCDRPTQADWQLCPYCGQSLPADSLHSGPFPRSDR